MFRFLVRRVFGALVILLIISAITFWLFYAVPRDPAMMSCGKNCTPENLEQIRKNLGIDESIVMQYWHWLSGIFAGRDYAGYGYCDAPCLGYSFANSQPVYGTIMDRLPLTLSLAFGAAVFFLIIGIGAGMLAASKQGKFLDKFASSVSLLGSSLQIYFVGYIAMFFLVGELGILSQPSYTPLTDDPVAWVSGLLLPWLVLSIIFTANYTRMTRSQMVEQLSEDYVRTARAKGLSGGVVVRNHVLRNSLIPVTTHLGVNVGGLMAGAVITEGIFNVPGVGNLAFRSIQQGQSTTVVSVVTVMVLVYVLMSLLVDLLYAVLDPRIRYA